MKLNQIKKACMATGEFTIVNQLNGRQWLSNGQAMWPVEGICINEHSIASLFDLKSKQLEKIKVRSIEVEDPRYDANPQSDTEITLNDVGAVWHCGDLYRAVELNKQLMFMNVRDIKPAECVDDHLEFYARIRADGDIVIAAYGNMLVSAIIKPERTEDAMIILGTLRNISNCELAVVKAQNGGLDEGYSAEADYEFQDDETEVDE